MSDDDEHTCPECGAEGEEITRVRDLPRRRYVCTHCSTQWLAEDTDRPEQTPD